MSYVPHVGFGAMIQVGPRIWLGCESDALQLDALHERGITHVCSLTPDGLPGHEDHELNVLHLPLQDSEPIPRDALLLWFGWMSAATRSGGVLVHCEAGMSRAPAMLIAWQMWRAGADHTVDLRTLWSRYEDQLRLFRPVVSVHWKLKDSIIDFFGTMVAN